MTDNNGTLTPEQRARLRELALAATCDPCQWATAEFLESDGWSPQCAAYIAAAHPQAILALLTAHDALAARVRELEALKQGLIERLADCRAESGLFRVEKERDDLAAENRALLSRVEALTDKLSKYVAVEDQRCRQIAALQDRAAMAIRPEPLGVTLRPFTPEEVAALDTATRPPEAPGEA